MATSSSLPSSPAASQPGAPVAPPNFYAQAASAQPPPAAAQPDNTEDTKKFRAAIDKLAGVDGIFTKLEKLKPNGVNVEKKVKAIAQSLKDLYADVMEGNEGDDEGSDGGDGTSAAGQTNAASPPPAAPAATGGPAGTGA